MTGNPEVARLVRPALNGAPQAVLDGGDGQRTARDVHPPTLDAALRSRLLAQFVQAAFKGGIAVFWHGGDSGGVNGAKSAFKSQASRASQVQRRNANASNDKPSAPKAVRKGGGPGRREMDRRNFRFSRKAVGLRVAEDQEEGMDALHAGLSRVVVLGVGIPGGAELGDPLLGVDVQLVQRAEEDALGRAGLGASRDEATRLAVVAEGTLERAARVFERLLATVDHAEGTGDHAVAAAVADVVLDEDGLRLRADDAAGGAGFQAAPLPRSACTRPRGRASGRGPRGRSGQKAGRRTWDRRVACRAAGPAR